MEALRWILLLIGLVLIAGIYWLGRRQGQDERREGLFERARRAARDDQGSDEPAADPVEPDLDIGDIDLHGFDVEDRPGAARETADRSTTADTSDTGDGRGTGQEAVGAAAQTPDEHHPEPSAVAEDPPIDSVSVEAPPDESPGAEREADSVTGPEPVARSAPESDRVPGPAREPGQAPGNGREPEREPVVARPENQARPENHMDTPDTARASTDTEPTTSSGGRREEREPRGEARDSEPEERVVVLHVVAPEGERLVGARLREALESCGMRHGAYSIFHASDSEGSIVFSAANAVEPGTFDRSTMDTLTTPGIALFMQVPGAQSAETVFDRMLSTARAVADALEAHVLDERHSTLTRQTEQHLREELRLLDRRTGSLQR